jgi:hypothetical protein
MTACGAYIAVISAVRIDGVSEQTSTRTPKVVVKSVGRRPQLHCHVIKGLERKGVFDSRATQDPSDGGIRA